jgi:putative transposase
MSGRYKDGVLWSPSYFAGSCAGAPLSTIAEYLRNQREAAPPPVLKDGSIRHGD